MTTGCFQESKFHWPLSGNEFEKRTVSSDPFQRVSFLHSCHPRKAMFCALEFYEAAVGGSPFRPISARRWCRLSGSEIRRCFRRCL